jgi:hypothetical protein
MFTKILHTPSSDDEFLLIWTGTLIAIGGGALLILVALFMITYMIVFEEHDLSVLTIFVNVMWGFLMLMIYFSFGFISSTLPFHYFASKFIRPTKKLIWVAVFVNFVCWFIMKDYFQYLAPQERDSDLLPLFFAMALGFLSIGALALLISVSYSYLILDANRTQKINNKDVV